MSYCISHHSLQYLPCIDLQGFKSSGITVIVGSSSIVPEILYQLCAASVISSDKDAIFVDGGNSFNPYTLSKVAKSSGAESRKVLSRIHVARAFTEYQMDALMGEQLCEAIESWNPAVLAISYLPSLFSGIMTVITSFGGALHGDRLLAAGADRVVRIEQPSKKLIKIIDNGHVFEYMPMPPGQMRFTDFTNLNLEGGDSYGQDSSFLSHVA